MRSMLPALLLSHRSSYIQHRWLKALEQFFSSSFLDGVEQHTLDVIMCCHMVKKRFLDLRQRSLIFLPELSLGATIFWRW